MLNSQSDVIRKYFVEVFVLSKGLYIYILSRIHLYTDVFLKVSMRMQTCVHASL